MSTSPQSDENGFSLTTALVECSPEERLALERLIDEYHPMVDIFSVRVRLPNIVELDVQFESDDGDVAAAALEERLGEVSRNGSSDDWPRGDGV